MICSFEISGHDFEVGFGHFTQNLFYVTIFSSGEFFTFIELSIMCSKQDFPRAKKSNQYILILNIVLCYFHPTGIRFSSCPGLGRVVMR